MKSLYQDLQQTIRASDELKQRTMRTARQAAGNTSPAKPKRRHAFRVARRLLSAVCAFVLLVGGIALWQQRPVDEVAGDVVASTFGVVAYAADGEILKPVGNLLAFDIASSGVDDPDTGYFTGCLMKLTGENIKQFSVSFDREGVGLYRHKTTAFQPGDNDKIYKAIQNGETPDMDGADQVMIESDDEALQNVRVSACWKLSSAFTEPYDPDASYGFWVAPGINESASESDLQAASHARIDAFNNVNMSITVTFTDGSQATQVLHLKTGKLVVAYEDGHSGPRPTGAITQGEEPYIYGIYAELS